MQVASSQAQIVIVAIAAYVEVVRQLDRVEVRVYAEI
jgi:hypothetical protein